MRKYMVAIHRLVPFMMAVVLAASHPLVAMASTQEVPAPSSGENTTTPQEEEPELTYTYNEGTGMWDSEKWQYNPTTNVYEAPPVPVVIAPENQAVNEPQSESSIAADTSVTVNNSISSDATSGDATVSHNTTAGNATSGNAEAMVTLINTVNSTLSGTANGQVASFTHDILGDVKGDIILHPMLLKAMLEAEVKESDSTMIDVNNNLAINNNVNVHAGSGNATVANNTTAGNATTGSARAMANVVNILNSMIAAQNSFIGTINIYGNLEGDILIAPDFIPQMLANNGGDASDIQVSVKDTQTIVNDISTIAESGAASVFGNTDAGDATSGDARSNVVIFNLTGHEVIAKNSLLVFVNVLGKWVGVIVDAPEGASAAMIGNEVEEHNYTPDMIVDAELNHGIVNTVAVSAHTGDAVVSNNTTAGNATSGNATAIANIANVSGSQLGLAGWFGVLFINVYQDWYGSFGVNTFYGDTIETEESLESSPNNSPPIQFVPRAAQTPRDTHQKIVLDDRLYVAVASEPVIQQTVVHEVTESSNAASVRQVVASTSTDQAVRGVQTAGRAFDFRPIIVVGSLALISLSVVGLKRLFFQ